MASNQDDKIDFSVFGEELSKLLPRVQDIYGSLLNNGMYAVQPHCKMNVRVVKAALGCYFGLVRSVYIQSPQVAYVDICPGNELTSPGFCRFFYTGVHRASFPDSLTRDCDVIFHPLAEKLRPDQMYSMAIAVAEDKQLPGMNLDYFYRNPDWNPSLRPKLLELPSLDDLDL